MRKLAKIAAIMCTAFVALMFATAIAGVLMQPSIGEGTVVRILFSGDIPERPNHGLEAMLGHEPTPTLYTLTEGIRHAATDQNVVGLILDVRNPSVGVAQLQEIEEAMDAFRKSNKWNAAFLETAGEFSRGDGAYALAVMADHVVLAPPGEINLVGIRAEVPFVKGALDKLEIPMHVVQRHAYKNAANMFTQGAFTQEHREALKALVDDLQQDLIDHIATRRKTSVDKVWAWMRTAPHDAVGAKEKGLIDEVGYWDSMVAAAKKQGTGKQPIVDMPYYLSTLRDDAATKLALIYGTGQVLRGKSDGIGDQAMGSETLTQAFRAARKAKVKGVLFRIDSPGGSYIASDLIRREVALTRAAGIPVVASMGAVAASGGYFVAMDANHIVANPGSITGSIGVLAASFATRHFFQRWLGVTFDAYETNPMAGIFSNLDLPTKEQKKRIDQALDRIYDDFVTKAAKGRNMPHDEMDVVAQGRVWSGRAAHQRKLVDELGGMFVAQTRLKEAAGLDPSIPVSLVVYPAPKGGFEQLIEWLSEGVSAGKVTLRFLQQVRGVMGMDDTILRAPLPRLQ